MAKRQKTSRVVQSEPVTWSSPRLKDTLQKFVRKESYGVEITAEVVAFRFIEQEPTLALQVNVGTFARLVRGIWREDRPANPYMELLFGFTGLTDRLPLKDGGAIRVGKASVPRLRESIRVMKAEDKKKAKDLPPNPKIAWAESLIEAMKPLPGARHGLDVERYCERIAAGEATEKK